MSREWWIGNQSRLPFDVLVSLRSLFLVRPLSTALAVVAVTASVALAASVEIASRSVSEALDRSMRAVAGSTEWEISAGGLGVSEDLIEPLRDLESVRSASPVIQETFRVTRADGGDEPLRVLGLDLLYDGEVRDYGVSEGGLVLRDHVRLVAKRDSIVLAEAVAARLGVREGDGIVARSGSGAHRLVLRGLLTGDLGGAYGGSLGVMDVYALQELVGRRGIVDRIDLAGSPGRSGAEVEAAIASVVADDATVRRSTIRDHLVTPVLAAYGFGIWAITLIGVLIALFLTHAVISIVVDRRIVEFALLRAAGMDGSRAARMVAVDAMVLAVLATGLGIAAAYEFGGSLVVVLSTASEFYQELAVRPAPFTAETATLAALVGIPTALVACLEPARRAARRRPLEVLHARPAAGAGAGPGRRMTGIGLLGLAACVVATTLESGGPGFRLAAAIVGGVVAVWCLGGAWLPILVARGQALGATVLPRVGALVGSSIGDRPVETGATIGVWAAVVGAAIALLVSLQGLGQSMDAFITGENGPDAIVAFAEDPSATGPVARLPLAPEIARRFEDVPGVRAAWASQSATVIFRGSEIAIDDYDVERLVANGGLRGISDDDAASIAALRAGELLASDAFRRHFGLRVGDRIELPTKEGPREFRIGGSSRSFRGPKGKLSIRTRDFERWFRSRGAESIVFWSDRETEQAIHLVRSAIDDVPLFFRSGEDFRRQARRTIGRFSSLLTLPLLVVGVIGLVGLSNLLLGNVAARSRDLSVMRAVGATSLNLLAVVSLSAAVVATLGTLAGIALGLCWTVVIRDAISVLLGWRMSVAIDWALAAKVATVALGAAVAASSVPVVLTMRGRPPNAP
ncbi:hypothetical protein MYXO_03655 [Myxococcaceae bacterium]|jgi:putative ABC transport system permease protein|nr:hypothetical protein MYXO_03655 [Myxococcaceae bacterium]